MSTIETIKSKYGVQQNDAEDVLAGFRKSLPTLFYRASDLLKSEGAKSQKYVAAADKFFAELQRLRKIGMDQKALYSEYLQKMDRTFPKI